MIKLQKKTYQFLLTIVVFLLSFLGYPIQDKALAHEFIKLGVHHQIMAEKLLVLDAEPLKEFFVKNKFNLFQKVKKFPSQYNSFTDIKSNINFIAATARKSGTSRKSGIPKLVQQFLDLFRGSASEIGRPTYTTTAAGGGRGPCFNIKNSLLALVPNEDISFSEEKDSSSSDETKLGLGLTFDESPTLWFYIPKLPNYDKSWEAEFMLQYRDDGNDKNVQGFDKPVTIKNIKPGILFGLNTSLLNPKVSLDPSKAYHWYFTIICDPLRPSRNVNANAWIRRISPQEKLELSRQIENATDRERIKFYIEKGIWHEALNLIAKLRCRYPNDALLKNQWSDLLESIDINDPELRKNITEASMCSSDNLA